MSRRNKKNRKVHDNRYESMRGKPGTKELRRQRKKGTSIELVTRTEEDKMMTIPGSLVYKGLIFTDAAYSSGGFSRKEIAEIAPQLMKIAMLADIYKVEKYGLVSYDGQRYYVKVEPNLKVTLPPAKNQTGLERYVRTDNPEEIADFKKP